MCFATCKSHAKSSADAGQRLRKVYHRYEWEASEGRWENGHAENGFTKLSLKQARSNDITCRPGYFSKNSNISPLYTDPSFLPFLQPPSVYKDTQLLPRQTPSSHPHLETSNNYGVYFLDSLCVCALTKVITKSLTSSSYETWEELECAGFQIFQHHKQTPRNSNLSRQKEVRIAMRFLRVPP